MTLSYFTGEQHSGYFKQIIRLAEELGYAVRVYESKQSSQFDFYQAVFRDTVTIVDVTIPDDLTLSTVYPILTAHINILDHILVFSDKLYEDGTQILPLNITPPRVRTDKHNDLLEWLRMQLEDLKEHKYYERFEMESKENIRDYKIPTEKIMNDSIKLHQPKESEKKRVMISYRNSCSKEVERFRKQEEAKGKVEIKVLPPGSLCDDYEAHTPMRRWMLVSLLEDHIRSVNEVWVYYNDIYTNSWWTLAEMVLVAYINYNRTEENKVKLKVYDARKKRFLDESEEGYPTFLHVKLTNGKILKTEGMGQMQKLARYLSNTRPGSMGPENNGNIKQMKMIAFIMRFFSEEKRMYVVEQMRPMIKQMIPSTLSKEEQKIMEDGMINMYSDPKALMAYANDAVFKDEFWYNISYQTERVTAAFKDGSIDVDAFIDTPMQELTKLKDKNLRAAADSNSRIKLKGNKYDVCEGKTRYLWLATRNEIPTVKDAPGIEIVQTYNLTTPDETVK